MTKSPLSRRAAVALLCGLLSASCYDFSPTGPEDPQPESPPQLVNVTVEYRQPNECVAGSPRCLDNVVFFGSWMQPGGEFFLQKDPGRFVWRGVARGVPVNFPPRDQAHYVRVYDPHVVGSPTLGVTAERLKVGGEFLTVFDSPGGPRESGLVYIDDNGFGHNPF